jgi:carboxymethylenebutenolidase
MDVHTEYVTLAVSDGTSMRAYVARPTNPAASRGLMVFQEAFGVNAHIRDVTERYAREGYLAIAPDLFHRTAPGFDGRYDDFPSVMEHLKALKDPGMEADERAAFDWLRANSGDENLSIGAIGYCMGGRVAFLSALTLPVACAISFYGGGIAPSPYFPGLLDRAKDLRAPVLFFWGGKDKNITPQHTRAVADELKAAGKSYISVEISDADHGFFCDARASYNPTAAREAWPLTLSFLDTQISAERKNSAAQA